MVMERRQAWDRPDDGAHPCGTQLHGTGRARLVNNPGEASFGITTTFTADTTVGPFPVTTRHMLRCVPSSHISYDIAPADFPAVISDVERIAKLTQAEYDALTPDPAG
jgi:hypothetical protein